MHIIGGKFKRRQLLAPKGATTRPTQSKVREMLFNVLQQQIEGALFLDLFAGSGLMGFEALSRGAAHVVFVEQAITAFKTIEKNIRALGVSQECTLIRGDLFKHINRLPQAHIVFADPPYGKGYCDRLLTEGIHLVHVDGLLFLEDTQFSSTSTPQFQLIKERHAGKTLLREYCRLAPTQG